MAEGAAPTPAPGAPTADAGGAEQTTQADTGSTGSAPESTQAKSDEDAEGDFFGEKLKKSELKRLREVEAKQKEHARGANEKFQKASEFIKEARALVGDLPTNTKAALIRAGVDPIKFAQDVLSEALAEEEMTPEQKELRDTKAERDRLKKEAEDAKKASDEAQDAQIVDGYTNDFAQAFVGALKQMNLPEDDLPELVVRMAIQAEAALDNGVPIDLAQIAADVGDRYRGSPMQAIQGLSPLDAVKRYPDVAEIFRKGLLEQANQQPAAPIVRTQSAPPKPKGRLTREEFDERVSRRIAGG